MYVVISLVCPHTLLKLQILVLVSLQLQVFLTAHKTYTKGCKAYDEIVKTFGDDIVDDKSGEIIRRRLGEKVFGDKVTAIDFHRF